MDRKTSARWRLRRSTAPHREKLDHGMNQFALTQTDDYVRSLSVVYACVWAVGRALERASIQDVMHLNGIFFHSGTCRKSQGLNAPWTSTTGRKPWEQPTFWRDSGSTYRCCCSMSPRVRG